MKMVREFGLTGVSGQELMEDTLELEKKTIASFCNGIRNLNLCCKVVEGEEIERKVRQI